MAKKVQVTLVDDIDGSEAEETVYFALDGKEYKIDLNEDNAQRLREDLSKYVGHAERTAAKPRGSRKPASSRRGDAGAVREWARSQGMEVSERGRIPSDVQSAYDAAH